LGGRLKSLWDFSSGGLAPFAPFCGYSADGGAGAGLLNNQGTKEQSFPDFVALLLSRRVRDSWNSFRR
jgi:hypothetical protein